MVVEPSTGRLKAARLAWGASMSHAPIKRSTRRRPRRRDRHPEPGGLEPGFVVELIRRLRRVRRLAGGDVVEVAPGLGDRESNERTLAVAVRNLKATIAAALGIWAG